ncbi:MAG: DUF3379 family protein [Rhodocyclaceae bacterium]|nr:DUF3379 family protein [Rhodocyclaceae bacterium]MBX3667492.1 DUF3379 family protein [Rhodocyclaceae bacterium]
MNCLEFRRRKLADPRRADAAMDEHVAQCPGCQSFARRLAEQEQALAQTLLVPVPEGLAERVIMRTAGGNTRRPSLRLMALAASVVLTLSVTLVDWYHTPGEDYARYAIEHVMHEPESFSSRRLVEASYLDTILRNFGAELRAPLGTLRYAKLCPVPNGTGWHLVLDTEHGTATVLLIPHAQRNKDITRAAMAGMNSEVMPLGQGYVAVVADDAERARDVGKLLTQRVDWSALSLRDRKS